MLPSLLTRGSPSRSQTWSRPRPANRPQSRRPSARSPSPRRCPRRRRRHRRRPLPGCWPAIRLKGVWQSAVRPSASPSTARWI
ncbi:MAG TPA: hypothetical protein ENK56_04845 [Chloroflexi bacterium]|nr:hypothetical protein [Chloroflexota bacterium]